MRLSTRVRTAVAAAVLLSTALVYPLLNQNTSAHAAASSNDVIAENLFEWPWTSVAAECTTVLGPAGYGAVQVAPPEDSISVPATRGGTCTSPPPTT